MKNKLFILLALLAISSIMSAQFVIHEQPLVLKTSNGNIYGTLKAPNTSLPVPVVIIIAGSGPMDRNGNEPLTQNNAYKMLSEALYFNNIATLCYDKRGIGESASAIKKESDLRFEDLVSDVRDSINLLSVDKRFSTISILGHSEGSLIGMIACEGNTKVNKFVSVSGAGLPFSKILKNQLIEQLTKQSQSLKDQIFSYIDKLTVGETISDVPSYSPLFTALFRPSVQPFLISIFKYNPCNEIAKLTMPTLIIQGSTDIQVSVSNADLLASSNTRARKIIIDNMNHVLKDCDTMDRQKQAITYNDSSIPLNKQIGKVVATFIKE